MNNFPKRIGVTGGIGSGKSYVCRVLAAMGYPVFYADIEARNLINSNSELIHEIKSLFGESAYVKEEFNRKFVGERVFKDPTLLAKMNALIHPKVRATFDEWSQKQNSKYVFQEAAILIETEGYKLLDKTVLVTASIETKVKRIKERDNLSEEAIQNRMNAQLNDEEKKKFVDYIIENDNDKMLLPQIVSMFKTLFNEAI